MPTTERQWTTDLEINKCADNLDDFCKMLDKVKAKAIELGLNPRKVHFFVWNGGDPWTDMSLELISSSDGMHTAQLNGSF